MGSLGRTICSVHLICAQIRREGIKCSKAKEFVAKVLLSNLYTVISGSDSLFRPSWKSENCTSFQQSSGLRTPKGTAYHNHDGLRNFFKEHSYYHEIPIRKIVLQSDVFTTVLKLKRFFAKTCELECTFRMDLKLLWTTLLDVDIQ